MSENPFTAPADAPEPETEASADRITVTVKAADYYRSWAIAFKRRSLISGAITICCGIILIASAISTSDDPGLGITVGVMLLAMPFFMRWSVKRTYDKQTKQLSPDDLQLTYTFDEHGILTVENRTSTSRLAPDDFRRIVKHDDYLLLFKTSRYYFLIPLYLFDEHWRQRVLTYFNHPSSP